MKNIKLNYNDSDQARVIKKGSVIWIKQKY